MSQFSDVNNDTKKYHHEKRNKRTNDMHKSENIIKESLLLSMFCGNKSVIKYIDFFTDESHYYLVMEKGGQGLFECNVNAHQSINDGENDCIGMEKLSETSNGDF